MSRKRNYRASSWKCDERGLFAVTPTGDHEAAIIEITDTSVRYRRKGRDYLYERMFDQARRRYEMHAATPGADLHETFRILTRVLLRARFAMLQPAWQAKRPYIYLYDEKCQIFRLWHGYLAFGWNDCRYTARYDGEHDDMTITPAEDAPPLPRTVELQVNHFARVLWKALKPKEAILVPGDAEYDIGMGMENPMGGQKPLPKHPEARALVLQMRRLENEGKDSSHISTQLSELSKRPKRKKHLIDELKAAPKAESLEAKQVRMHAEAMEMGMARGDHLLPEDDLPAEWEHLKE